MDEEDEMLLLSAVKTDKVNYVWYKEVEVEDDSLTTLFYFSSQEREGYTKMTRYYL